MSATSLPEAKKLLGGSVEESRAKRVEKQQSRYRDRGGYVTLMLLRRDLKVVHVLTHA